LQPPCEGGGATIHLVYGVPVASARRRLQEGVVDDAREVFQAEMTHGVRVLARLDAAEAARMLRLEYVFGSTFTLVSIYAPSHVGQALVGGDGAELCEYFRPQRLERVELGGGGEDESFVCPATLHSSVTWVLVDAEVACSLRWLMFALLVVGLLLLLLACLYGGWVVVGEREDWRRGTGKHLHARPGEGSYHGKVPPPPPPPVAAVKPTPPTVTERRPPRRIPRRGLVDPVAEHLENADEDIQDLQAITVSVTPGSEGANRRGADPFPLGAGAREPARPTPPSDAGYWAGWRDVRVQAAALLIALILALLAIIFAVSGVALLDDDGTLCATAW